MSAEICLVETVCRAVAAGQSLRLWIIPNRNCHKAGFSKVQPRAELAGSDPFAVRHVQIQNNDLRLQLLDHADGLGEVRSFSHKTNLRMIHKKTANRASHQV